LGTDFRFGYTGRNVITGPGVINWDFSLQKEFTVKERHNLELRWEVFNLPNHPLWDNPNGSTGTQSFGVIPATKIDNRQMQLALRYTF